MTNLKLDSKQDALELGKELFESVYSYLEISDYFDIWNMDRTIIEEKDFNIVKNVGIYEAEFVIDVNSDGREDVDIFFQVRVEEKYLKLWFFSPGQHGIEDEIDIDSILEALR